MRRGGRLRVASAAAVALAVTVALTLTPLGGCALIGSADEAPPGADAANQDNLDVVDDAGPFDPRQAVDDHDVAPGEASYAREGETPPQGEEAVEDVVDAGGQAAEGEEDVATDAEAEAIERSRAEDREQAERVAEEGGADDDETAAALASNPPVQEPPRGERGMVRWTALDVVLEGLLVAAAALGITGFVAFARTHKKTVAAGVALVAGVVAFVGWELG